MSPLPGILASQTSGHLWTPQGAWDAIASVELTSTVYSVNIAIPSGYKYLIIRGWNVSTGANNAVGCRFNNDAGSNYNYVGTDAPSTGATPSGYASTTPTYAPLGYTGGATYPAVFESIIYDIDSTNKTKTTRGVTGNYANGTVTSYLTTLGAIWNSLNPVNSITLLHGDVSKVFNAGSSFYVYGVK